MPRDNSKADVNKNPLLPKQTVVDTAPKLPLSVALKLEVTRMPLSERPNALEAAFALEEILSALEQGQSELPRLAGQGRPRIPNKLIEERMRKQEQEIRERQDDRKKLEERKRMLKEQLEKMKVEKEKKDKQEEQKKKEKDAKREEVKRRNQEKLQEDLNKLKTEFAEKREKR